MQRINRPKNIFNEVIRKIVREEIVIEVAPLKFDVNELKRDFGNFQTVTEQRHDLVMRSLDKVIGAFKNHDEAHTILADGHKRVLETEGKVEKLQKIHPQNQHVLAS